MVPRVHIVGRKNSGKTTLVCALVTELRERGWIVATVKHTHHHHELDTPGKDSHQHRRAGAAGVGIISPDMTAVFRPSSRDSSAYKYAAFQQAFGDVDLILVEGDLATDAPRLEVWRADVSEMPYAAEDSGITAVISDDPLTIDVPHWKRSGIAELASRIEQLLSLRESPSKSD